MRPLIRHEGDLGLFALGYVLDQLAAPPGCARPAFLDRAAGHVDAMLEDLAETEAGTLEGLFVQLRALARLYAAEPAQAAPLGSPMTLEDRLLRSIVIGALSLALDWTATPPAPSAEETVFLAAQAALDGLEPAGDERRLAEAEAAVHAALAALAAEEPRSLAGLPTRLRALEHLYRGDAGGAGVLEAEVETGAVEPRLIAGIIRLLLEHCDAAPTMVRAAECI